MPWVPGPQQCLQGPGGPDQCVGHILPTPAWGCQVPHCPYSHGSAGAGVSEPLGLEGQQDDKGLRPAGHGCTSTPGVPRRLGVPLWLWEGPPSGASLVPDSLCVAQGEPPPAPISSVCRHSQEVGAGQLRGPETTQQLPQRPWLGPTRFPRGMTVCGHHGEGAWPGVAL